MNAKVLILLENASDFHICKVSDRRYSITDDKSTLVAFVTDDGVQYFNLDPAEAIDITRFDILRRFCDLLLRV